MKRKLIINNTNFNKSNQINLFTNKKITLQYRKITIEDNAY